MFAATNKHKIINDPVLGFVSAIDSDKAVGVGECGVSWRTTYEVSTFVGSNVFGGRGS